MPAFVLRRQSAILGSRAKSGVSGTLSFLTSYNISGVFGAKIKAGVAATIAFGGAPPPPPPGPQDFFTLPTQADEQATYENILGWTGTTTAKKAPLAPTGFATNPPSDLGTLGHARGGGDIHGYSEADDLWNHYQMWKRTGEARYLNWATAWRDYFVGAYITQMGPTGGEDGGRNFDHLYGQGLVVWGVEQNDLVARNAALTLAANAEANSLAINPGVSYMSSGESRRYARRLIFYSYIVAMDPIQRWIDVRDNLLEGWLNSTGWLDTGNSNIVIGGNHFAGRTQYELNAAGGLGPLQYDQGYRYNHSFQYGLHTEALWLSYIMTGRADVRAMLIQMARYTLYYAWDPSHVNAMCGSRWGHTPSGGYQHDRYDEFSVWGNPSALGPPDVLWTDPNSASAPNYEIALVNIMVIGYKLTGETAFLTRAHGHLRQATQYANATVVGSGNPKLNSSQVHHYMDTMVVTNDPMYFNWNKGELQYANQAFENGGVPEVEGSVWVPPYASILPTAPGQVVKVAGDATPTANTVTWTAGDTTGSVWPTNVPADVRPAEMAGSSWTQAHYNGDTRTHFITSFSPGGAIVIAGSGGHGGSPIYGAALLDFTDLRFKRIWTTSGNPGVDNITSGNLDVRSGTKTHGCSNTSDQNFGWFAGTTSSHPTGYSGNACWNWEHWQPGGGGAQGIQIARCPLNPDPSLQTWEFSMPEPPPYDAITAPHGWRFPGTWSGLGNGRFPGSGYIMNGPNFNPPVAGTLAPTQSEIPAPGHIWDHYYELKPSEGGGPNGSIVAGRRYNIGTVGITAVGWSHRFDLNAGTYHEFGTNAPQGPQTPVPPAGGGPNAQSSAIAGAEDTVMRRAFLIGKNLHSSDNRVNYINLAGDQTWRNLNVGSGGGTPENRTENLFVDPDRRLLIVNSDLTPFLWAVDLQTLGTTGTPEPTPSTTLGGWRQIPFDDVPGVQSGPPWNGAAAGSANIHNGPANVNMVWRYYPPNGKFYRVSPRFVGGSFGGPLPTDQSYQITVLQRLTPPPIIATPRPDYYYTTEAMSGRWTLDEITLSRGLPVPDPVGGYAVCGWSWFHYVPALQLLAYAPLDFSTLRSFQVRRCVYLIKPF